VSDEPGAGGALLYPGRAARQIHVTRYPTPPELDGLVAYFWGVAWDLDRPGPGTQPILSHPCVHLTLTAEVTRVTGVQRRLFRPDIAGQGWVIGARFRPGGFRPFLRRPVTTITDRIVALPEILPVHSAPLHAAVTAAPDGQARARLVAEVLTEAADPTAWPAVAEANAAVDLIAASPDLVDVDAVAAQLGTHRRSLQRLFAEYVGVGPKWVIRRHRLQQVAAEAAAGKNIDWVRLAMRLGYSDQAHLIRDFTATVGESPARYAQACTTLPVLD
jgi:AraC-like DNA-binding protein